jgi:hypothetical protein
MASELKYIDPTLEYQIANGYYSSVYKATKRNSDEIFVLKKVMYSKKMKRIYTFKNLKFSRELIIQI